MAFWVRYAALIFLCVLCPLGLGFWADTQSELHRAQKGGETSAAAAEPALAAQLTMYAHELVGKALSGARQIGDEKFLTAKPPLRPEALAKIHEILSHDVVQGGFAWLVDEAGTIVARVPQVETDDGPKMIGGHPIFVSTQLGYAVDAFWPQGSALFYLGASPVVKDGEARGAVIVAEPVSQRLVNDLGHKIGTELTVLLGKDIIASSLPSDIAGGLVSVLGTGNTDAPVLGGRLAAPIGAGALPLFVPKDANGIAYSSLARVAPGSAGVRWVVSVDSTESLKFLPDRQKIILAVLGSALLLALVIGLMFHRSYVRPIGVLVEHLSEIQQGRGERELPESAIAKPFRRLIKLINMTVQRIPTSNFGFGDDVARPSLDVQEPAQGAPISDFGFGSIPSVPPAGILSGGSSPGHLGSSRPAAFSGPSFSGPPTPAPGLAAAQPSSELAVGSSASTRPAGAAPLASAPPAPLRLDPEFAAAIAALESQPMPDAKKPRSAAEIRGVPSTALATSGPPGVMPESALSAEDPSRLLSILEDMQQTPKAQAATDPFGGSAGPAVSARSGGSAAGPSTQSAPGLGAAGIQEPPPEGFRSEATVVAAPKDYLLQAATREAVGFGASPDRTVVADVPEDLLAESRSEEEDGGAEATETAHFREIYDRFIEMRRQCGEPIQDLAFDRFVAKLQKNRDGLIKKYNCRTVRFQVYEKDGKAALKATPVRA